jgi:hypothetical protein
VVQEQLLRQVCRFSFALPTLRQRLELAQALAQQMERFLDALAPLGGPVEAVVFEVAA